MLETVLEVKDLNVWYRGGSGLRKRRTQVLHDVSFTLSRREILRLLGESRSAPARPPRAPPTPTTAASALTSRPGRSSGSASARR